MYGLRRILLIGSVLLFCICTPVFLKMEKDGEKEERNLSGQEGGEKDRRLLSDRIPSLFITTKSGSLSYVESVHHAAFQGGPCRTGSA